GTRTIGDGSRCSCPWERLKHHVWNPIAVVQRKRSWSHPVHQLPKERIEMRHTQRWGVAAALAAAIITGISGTAVAQEEPKPLYERLGGVYSIATVVDDFIERLLVNDTLNANPAIKEARTRVPKAGLKFHVTALVCEVTGGPCKYSGRSMKEAHAHLNINE